MSKNRWSRAVLVCALAGALWAADVRADAPVNVHVQAGNLAEAIESLARQCGVYVIYPSRQLQGLRTQGVSGTLDAHEAFRRLIQGTPLIMEEKGGAILIKLPATPMSRVSGDGSGEGEGVDATRLAQAGAVGPGGAPAGALSVGSQGTGSAGSTRTGDGGSASSARAELGEIIVTAQKRAERLQDVPVPVTAISADALIESNQLRIQDYYTSIPGLNMAFSAYGNPELSIRGITAGADLNPSVGVTVDDVPYGSTTSLGGGSIVPDLDPSDLQRVEVLRGPQGTLYGANSLGGLFKYVTVDPSTGAFSARLQSDLNTVYNGNVPGYGVRGAVNVPLSDTLAIRVSGFVRHDPGYIDNVETGQRAVNEGVSGGGHLVALWRPQENLSLKVSALFQDSRRYGLPEVDRENGLSGLQQRELRDTGGYDRRYVIYSAVLNAKLGPAELTSITGYSQNRLNNTLDYSVFPFTDGLAQQDFGVSSVAFAENDSTSKVSQEVRVSMPLGDHIDWLMGGFFTHEHSSHYLYMWGAEPASGAIVGTGAEYNFPTTYEEYAAFTDFTFHFTSQFDIQVGGRESWNRQTYSEVDSGPFIPDFYGGTSTAVVFPEIETRDNAFTYLVTPRYKFSENLMAYLRFASGYRPGGPNAEASIFGLPEAFRPDKTHNYEIGLKGEALDHRLTFDASLYYIDWKQIQLYVTDASIGYAFFANAGDAKSQGLELSSSFRPVESLTLSAWVSWDDAALTQSLPSTGPLIAAYGLAGDRLPYTPRFSGDASAEQRFPLGLGFMGFVGATVAYVSSRESEFQYAPPSVAPRVVLPAYARTDVRAGFRTGNWTVNLFGNNVTDRRGVLQDSGLLPNGATRINYIEPRMIGVSVSRTF